MKKSFIHILTWCVLITLGSFDVFAQARGNQQVIEVPFDLYRNEILLQVKVNGKGPFNMLLDTGTDPSAVDLATAKVRTGKEESAMSRSAASRLMRRQ